MENLPDLPKSLLNPDHRVLRKQSRKRLIVHHKHLVISTLVNMKILLNSKIFCLWRWSKDDNGSYCVCIKYEI